jgi:hypothetical protein
MSHCVNGITMVICVNSPDLSLRYNLITPLTSVTGVSPLHQELHQKIYSPAPDATAWSWQFAAPWRRHRGLAVPCGMRAQHAGDPRPQWCGISMELRLMRKKRGCAQCAHPGLRIQLYRPRNGPDSGCFRGSAGFSSGGARFESHLGHSVSARLGPFRGLQPVYKTRFMLARRAICG